MSTLTGFTVTLPFPPSVNAYWRSLACLKWVNGVPKPYSRMILSEDARAFRSNAILAVRCAKLSGLNLDSRLRVEIDLHCPTARKYDVDNFSKGIFDALTHAGLWKDDSQVDDLHVVRKPKFKGGMAIVRIWEVVE